MDALSQAKKALTRSLNDHFRRTFDGGMTLFSSRFGELPPETKAKVITAIKLYNSFNDSDDPHEEHDVCIVEIGGVRYIWKCDYYDIDMRFASDDPSDEKCTKRVATIFMADEI